MDGQVCAAGEPDEIHPGSGVRGPEVVHHRMHVVHVNMLGEDLGEKGGGEAPLLGKGENRTLRQGNPQPLPTCI